MKRILTAIVLASALSCTPAHANETLWKLNLEGRELLCSYFPPDEANKTAMVGRDVYWVPKYNQFFIKEGKKDVGHSNQFADNDPAVVQYEATMNALIKDARHDTKKERPCQRIIPPDLEQKVSSLPASRTSIPAHAVGKAAADSLTQAYANIYQVSINYTYIGMQVNVKNAKNVTSIDNRNGTTIINLK